MKYSLISLVFLVPALIFTAFQNNDNAINISPETEECIACHAEIHPGIVESWKKSLHSQVTPAMGMKKDKLSSRISSTEIDEKYAAVVTGCYECHSLNTDKHADAFDHNGYKINIVVSPDDCAVCHITEATEYSENIMANAYGNLMDNEVYKSLKLTINGDYTFSGNEFKLSEGHPETDNETCLYCHGTKVTVKGMETRETALGEMEFPVLEGWPNQGVGRINPDGSKGSCSSCHPRHDFSIETARKPYTCSECHKGPDVPAYKVYEVSKHGNIFSSKGDDFNFSAVPWKIGEDFTAPTCAACHASLLVDKNNEVIAERTHKFNDRLAWRLFGVPYAHPHPVSANLSDIKNSAGLPLITELDGTPVESLVISKEEQEIRNDRMKKICNSCHSTSWVNNHFDRLDQTIASTNQATITATNMLSEAWKSGIAEGLPQGKNIFDEGIEREWTEIWLFHANSVRFSSAMGGGGDYSVYANGRFQLTNKLVNMKEHLEQLKKSKKK